MQKVRSLAWRMLGRVEDADDLTQEVFLRIWQKPERFNSEKGQFAAWLYKVSSNACIDRLRKKTLLPASDFQLEILPDNTPDPEQQAIRAQSARKIRKAVATLPARQRLAVILAHFHGRGNIEIAQIMDVTVEAVESLLGRGRRKLKILLAEEIGQITGQGKAR
jgi:RNA polymerase sigma-70 factor (ECF subfamily)